MCIAVFIELFMKVILRSHNLCFNVEIRLSLLVCGYTFRRNNSSIFASLSDEGQLINERICFSGSKFFPLRVDPVLEKFCHPGKQKGSHKSCSPLQNWQKSMEVFPCALVIIKYSLLYSTLAISIMNVFSAMCA